LTFNGLHGVLSQNTELVNNKHLSALRILKNMAQLLISNNNEPGNMSRSITACHHVDRRRHATYCGHA
jgi:hypothetical protein